jgi:16S rRNA (uracil1498-N3)-methyltransferase
MTRCVRAYMNLPPAVVGEEFSLPEDEAVHLSRVLRLQSGARIEVLDGLGGRYACECVEVQRSKIKLSVLEVFHSGPLLPYTRIGIALGKGNKLEELIRPLTELGMNRLTPIISERTEGTFSRSKFASKKERWTKIAQEACKQSGNLWIPQFDEPVSFLEMIDHLEEDENAWMGSLRAYPSQLHPKQGSQKLAIFVGPEGGWTRQEEGAAENSGVSFFSLGRHVLRLETAAISALAVARQHLLC